MGNVELQQPSSKRKPIFGDKSSSKTHTEQKNREQPFETLKRYNLTEEKLGNGDQIKTYRNRNKVQKITRERVQPKNNQLSKQSSRVNNINDFLIHLRKQINEQSVRNSQVEQIGRQGEDKMLYSETKSHELVLNLRLENERLELQKYKGLVQRQLQKSHSIESIKVQGYNNEKKLIIKYEQYSKTKPGTSTGNTQLSLQQRIVQEQSKYHQKVERAHKLYLEIIERNRNLAEMVQLYQHGSHEKTGKKVMLQLDSKEDRPGEVGEQVRLSKIQHLFKNIDQLQNSQSAMQTQIKQALKQQIDYSESELSASFRQQS